MVPMTDGNDSKILLRSRDGRMPAGVYAGFTCYLGLDATLAQMIWAGGLRPQRSAGGVPACPAAGVLIPDESQTSSIAENIAGKEQDSWSG
jgi:PspC domain